MQETIESKVAAAILEKEIAQIEIGGEVFKVAPPSIATLILVSEIISRMPTMEKVPSEQVFNAVLHSAREYNGLGELVAVLILGAKGLTEERVRIEEDKKLFGLIRRKREVRETVDRKAELSARILEEVAPYELYEIVTKCFKRLEIGAFFALTTSLSEANLLTPTKGEVGEH